MVKILEIGPYPPPRTGWSVRIAHVQQALQQQGHCCVPLNLGPERKIRSPHYEDVQTGWDYVRKVRRYCQQGFLVHMHVNGESPKGFVLTLLALALGWLYGKRAVLTYHGGPEQIYVSRRTHWSVWPVLCLMIRLPQRIICNNEAVKARLVGLGAAALDVTPIPAFSTQYLEGEALPLPPAQQRFVEQHRPLLLTYLMYRDEFYVASVMRAVTQLAQQWPEIGLMVTGAGESADDIRQVVESAQAQAYVYHAGDVPHATFLHLLQVSKLYLRSHARDGVCSSVLEALALGIPVVASEDGSRPPGVLTFAIGETDEIVETVQQVLEQYDTVRRNLVRPALRDTVQDEVQLLVACAQEAA